MPVHVRNEKQDGIAVARIILDSAPLNILDFDQCEELLEAIFSIRDDDVARVVIVQGGKLVQEIDPASLSANDLEAIYLKQMESGS